MDVYRRALERAVEVRGELQVAQTLGVLVEEIKRWLAGKSPLPAWVKARVIDLVVEADLTATAAPAVLVVDDDPGALYGMAHLVKTMGYPVETAHSGEHAVELARRLHPRVILIDLRLPDMDGCELGRRLRDEPFQPRLIAATAYGELADRDRAAAAGFQALLLKPLDAAKLEPYLPRMT
jgi:CheY-like chemotaxis protein